MNTFTRIINTIFGQKYYLPIYVCAGTFKLATSATPYKSKKEAERAAFGLQAYTLVEIISFRSKLDYQNGELK